MNNGISKSVLSLKTSSSIVLKTGTAVLRRIRSLLEALALRPGGGSKSMAITKEGPCA